MSHIFLLKILEKNLILFQYIAPPMFSYNIPPRKYFGHFLLIQTTSFLDYHSAFHRIFLANLFLDNNQMHLRHIVDIALVDLQKNEF